MNLVQSNKAHLSVVTLVILLISLFFLPMADAQLVPVARFAQLITTLIKSDKALPDEMIRELSRLAGETGGTRRVGDLLGELNLPDDVLEDVFMRVAIHQNKIDRIEAEGIHGRLAGTLGYRTTLRKITGNNVNGTAGHLNELRIANSASKSGYKVVAIGDSFVDGLKRAPTDLDVILEKNGKTVVIEAKDYRPTTALPMDSFRADMNTLVVYKNYKNSNPDNVLPVFTLSNKPDDIRYLNLITREAERRGIKLLTGTPDQLVYQIDFLVSQL